MNYGKHRTRRSYARIKEVLDLPNLIEIQTNSYQWFLDEGLKEMFDDIMPIDDFQGKLSLEFVGYQLLEPKYTVEEARQHDANYSAPLHVTLRLTNHETGEIKSQDVFFGDFPLMTKQGTFIINGAERVIVSQLVRSPGVYFHSETDKNSRVTYGTTVIPNRGAWLEYETDAKDIAYVRIDRTRKIPLTELVRALGFGSDQDIINMFGDNDSLMLTLEKDVHKNTDDSRTDEALKDIYERLRPGEPKTADSSRSLLYARFFDPKRYDLASVGRYKVNKKLSLKTRLLNQVLAETLANYARKGTLLGVTGRIQTRSYDNQQGQRVYVTEVVADNFQLLESRNASEQRRTTESGGNTSYNTSGSSGFGNNSTNQNQSSQPSGMPNFDRDNSDPFGNSSIDISDDDLPF